MELRKRRQGGRTNPAKSTKGPGQIPVEGGNPRDNSGKGAPEPTHEEGKDVTNEDTCDRGELESGVDDCHDSFKPEAKRERESETAETQSKDTETTETEYKDTETTETQSKDTETTETECKDTETTETEYKDTETTQAQCEDTETDCKDTETTETQSQDTETTQAECEDTETEYKDTETTETQSKDTGTTQTQCEDTGTTQTQCEDSATHDELDTTDLQDAEKDDADLENDPDMVREKMLCFLMDTHLSPNFSFGSCNFIPWNCKSNNSKFVNLFSFVFMGWSFDIWFVSTAYIWVEENGDNRKQYFDVGTIDIQKCLRIMTDFIASERLQAKVNIFKTFETAQGQDEIVLKFLSFAVDFGCCFEAECPLISIRNIGDFRIEGSNPVHEIEDWCSKALMIFKVLDNTAEFPTEFDCKRVLTLRDGEDCNVTLEYELIWAVCESSAIVKHNGNLWCWNGEAGPPKKFEYWGVSRVNYCCYGAKMNC
jgi:hypothetical protein